MYFSRRKTRAREPDEVGELNIVPYLDIMMNLVMFMLLTMTALVTLGVLNVAAPKYGAAVVPDTVKDPKPKLTLTIGISRNGFFVAGSGAVLPGQTAPGGAINPAEAPTIPLKAGAYDYDALTVKMVEIKRAFPEESRVILAADPSIEYEILVATMDACREDKNKDLLFFDVALAQM